LSVVERLPEESRCPAASAVLCIARSTIQAVILLLLKEIPMGERARGKDKGKAKKSPKAAKAGRRPHELHQQMRDALKRPTDAPG
jgi:hypothetical protein